MGGDVVVEDDVDVGDVETSAGHVCRYQYRPALRLELVKGSQPLVLRHLTVQGDGGEAQVSQHQRQLQDVRIWSGH